MKRIMVLAAIALLTLGVLGSSGCSKKVTRQADVAAGDYYTEEEFKGLSDEQRDRYCEDLAGTLEGYSSDTAKLEADSRAGDLDDLRSALARLQSQYAVQGDRVEKVKQEIDYFEGLPTSYSVVRGDCLWNISGQEQIYADPLKWPRIYRANRDQIKDPDLIYPDQVLDIPRSWPKAHTVVRGEWLSKIAGYWEIYDNYREWPKIYEANRDQISDPDLIYPDQVLDIPR